MSTEIENFKEELAAKAKEIVDLQTALDNANATISNANQESTTEAKAESEQPAKPKTKTELDEREAELNTREASLSQRDQKLKGREDKNKQLVQSLNDKLKAARAQFEGQVAELDAKHKVELERLQQEKEAAQGASKDTKAEPEGVRTTETVPDGIVNTDDLARPTVTESQLAGWLKNNAGALRVVKKQIQNNVTRQTASKDEMINKLRQEIEQANAQKAIDAITNPVKQEAGQAKPDWEEERAKLDAEWEKKLVLKETNMVKMAEMKAKLKDGNFATLKAKFGYVEKAAKETPAEEVAKVYAIAVTQKATKHDPATQPATPAKPAFVQPVPNTSTPQQQLQTATSANNTPQANGATDAPAAQVPQPVPFQQPSPFIQAAGHGIPANPFLPGHQQMGRGLAQPGFAVQGAAQAQQPHQQQFGVGNGSQAIRGVLSSNIPRGGASNIPMPGGRGRGQNQQQQQPNPQLHQNQQSNIGRGGGRGGRGRGNQPNQQGGQNQSSPRTSLNPGAAGFQPGQQGGRGQKRGAEDEGDGSTIRGGKRQRGGRGGGGAPAQGE
jgi:nucleoprotein TPR